MTLPFSVEALLEAIDGIAYAVDRDGIILGYSLGAWAAEDGGSSGPWHPGHRVGTSLFSMMQGGEVKESYQLLHQAVWSGGSRTIGFEFRCDAPQVERHMRMSLSLIRNATTPVAILYQSTIVSETPRVPLPLFGADILSALRDGNSDERTVKLCSYCQKVAWPIGAGVRSPEWIEAADFYRRDSGEGITVSHGVCMPCLSRVKDLVARSAADKAAGRTTPRPREGNAP